MNDDRQIAACEVTMLEGKGAMVWQLRNWMDGAPQAQAEHAGALGLAWVSLKVIDGRRTMWEDPRYVPIARQNASLLPEAAAALQAAGVRVYGWGYTYGGVHRLGVFIPSRTIAEQEGNAVGPALTTYSMDGFQIDAEREYRRGPGRAERAEAYCLGLSAAGAPQASLCSYRFPRTSVPDFPTSAFAPYMENWSPQVYWIRDHRPHGGAAQLEMSVSEYQAIRPLPMTPIGPTYPDRGWRSTPLQLRLFFEKAREMGVCAGVGVWCLDQASPDQLEALAEFTWR
jgi:hypothetical protein